MELIINARQIAEKGLYQCCLIIREDLMETLVFQMGVGFWQVERKHFRQQHNEKALS